MLIDQMLTKKARGFLPGPSCCFAHKVIRHHRGQAQISLAQINLSKARFFLVPEGQNIYGIVGRFMAVQSHIPGVTEGNN